MTKPPSSKHDGHDEQIKIVFKFFLAEDIAAITPPEVASYTTTSYLFAFTNLINRVNLANPTKLFPLKIKSYLINGEVKESIAFNDVSLIRDTRQIAKISIEINGAKKIDQLLCDGCLISTPAGSSAYNLSLRGPVVPVDAQLLALTPISPYRPRRWRGALLPNTVKITLTGIEEDKRPLRAEADFFEVKEIKKLEIELDKSQYMNLLFDKGHDLEERIINEQFIY